MRQKSPLIMADSSRLRTRFIPGLVVFLTLLLCGCEQGAETEASPVPTADSRANSLPEQPAYIALLAAYQGEFAHLLENMSDLEVDRIERINGARFHIGSAQGKPVLLFETGIGLVNAAMTLQLALDHFDISHILFSGVAGGIDPNLKKGDLSVAAHWHYTEFGARFTEDETEESGYRVPEFMQTRIADAHINEFFPYPKQVLRQGLDAPQLMPFFDTDPTLLELAEIAAENISLINAQGEAATILTNSIGGSGLSFNDSAAMASFMRDHWGSASVDMESAALAHVAWSNQIPILQVRAISDLVGNDQPNEFYEFKSVAEANAAKLLNEILTAMIATP